MLYLRTIQEKYIKMYERFVNQLKEYAQTIRVLSKGYSPISLLPPSKLARIMQVLSKTNKNYGLVMKGCKQMIKENCIFDYYFNKTDVKSSILDGGYIIVLAS